MPDRLTQLLNAAIAGDRDAEAEVLSTVYREMRHLAARLPPNQNPIQPTVLANEIWLRLFRGTVSPRFANRRAFYGYVAQAMRNLLHDYARKDARQASDPLEQIVRGIECKTRVRYLDLEEALDEMSRRNQRQAKVVHLKFFAGLSLAEIAQELEVSVSTVERDWRLAKALLRVRLLDTEMDP